MNKLSISKVTTRMPALNNVAQKGMLKADRKAKQKKYSSRKNLPKKI